MPAYKITIFSPGPIPQSDLEHVLGLTGQIDRLMEQRDELIATILRRLRNGSKVEPGLRSFSVHELFEAGERRETLQVW